MYIPGFNSMAVTGHPNITSHLKLVNNSIIEGSDYVGADGVYRSRDCAYILDVNDGYLLFQLQRQWKGRYAMSAFDINWANIDFEAAAILPILSTNLSVSQDTLSEGVDADTDTSFILDPNLMRYALCSSSKGSLAGPMKGQAALALIHKIGIGGASLIPYVMWDIASRQLRPADPWTRYSLGTPIECFIKAGEIIHELNPTAGAADYWKCSSGGALAPAWVTATAVGINQLKLSDTDKIYRAQSTGTTGATAPTGTGTNIDDDNILWDYVCPLAVIFARP
jgi:hypothetical protein